MATPFSIAMFPVGESNRRVVWIVYDDHEQILYQETQKGRPRTVWYLTLTKGRGAKPLHGSLRRQIYEKGMHIKSQHLIPQANAVLDAESDFASYSYMTPVSAIVAGFPTRDGKRAQSWTIRDPRQARPPFLPVTPEEAKRLGLGGMGWVPRGHKLTPLGSSG
jgi:hypothetical protein